MDNDDKTRFQPPSKKSDTSEPPVKQTSGGVADDDKTRMAAPKSAPKPAPISKPAASANVPKVGATDQPVNAEDATTFQPRKKTIPAAGAADANGAGSQVNPSTVSTNADDATTFQPRKSRAAQASSTTDDATRVAAPTRAKADAAIPASPADNDKTQFNPQPRNTQRTGNAPVAPPSPPTAVDEAGHEVLKGRFVLEKVIGAGGMGVVYRAKDLLKVEAQDRDPYVAIKVLSDEFKAHPEAFIALQRESRKTQQIAHPNIVNVHDFDKDGDTVFMTMEFLSGEPLDQLIGRYRATGLPEEDVWKILEGISAALIYAHDQGLVHADFKPGNIFVTKDSVAKVFDFGIARAVSKAEQFEESEGDKTVFDAGDLGALTPAYASYEMLEGEMPDFRDDIYALGCIAYEMFTGSHPFGRVNASIAKAKKLKPKRIPFLSSRQWKVIESALAFERENRVESVEAFWQQLTKKAAQRKLAILMVMLVIGLTSAIVYQNYFVEEIVVSEDEVRSEIEREFLINDNKKEIEDLLAEPTFTATWEKNILNAVMVLRKYLGEDDVWLLEKEAAIYRAYQSQIVVLAGDGQFEQALALIDGARPYQKNEQKLLELANIVNEKRAEYEKAQAALAAQNKRDAASKKQKRIIEQEKKQAREAYDVAITSVNRQLSCRSTMNMRDLDIAVSKLSSLDAKRFNADKPSMIKRLVSCIEKIGTTYPERGEEFKKRAMRIFPGEAQVSEIKIKPKDPCGPSIAGLGARGARAICRDHLKHDGEALGRGPAMVVIPAKGSIKSFAIGKYELTVQDYQRYCSQNNSCGDLTSDSKMPVTNISVSQIGQYIKWLNSVSGQAYRLPTQAEWVYAARANRSNLDSNRNCLLDSRGIKKGGVLLSASTGKQNAWGLVNYVGNAQEIVAGSGGYVAIGGSYNTAMEDCKVNYTRSFPSSGEPTTGFRLLREIAQ